MEYITIVEAADLWGITRRRVQVLCTSGRIEGVQRFGHSWAIPKDAQKPIDLRIRSGKYVKKTDDTKGTTER